MNNADNYCFHVSLNTQKAQFPIQGIPDVIDLSPYPHLMVEEYLEYKKLYLHIDLELLQKEYKDVSVKTSMMNGEFADTFCIPASDNE